MDAVEDYARRWIKREVDQDQVSNINRVNPQTLYQRECLKRS
jgi:hypothetical protein